MRISDWSSDVCSSDLLREEGEKKYTLDGEYRDTRGNQVYGYQLLGPLLHSVDSHYLLTEVGDGMLEFETTFAHENGGHLPWNIRMVDGEPASVTRLTSSFATERSEEHTSELQSLLSHSYAL